MRATYLILLIVVAALQTDRVFAQDKMDNKWIMGYDTSLLVPGGDAILLDFGQQPVGISNISTVHNFHMEGSNTSMCDREGNLLFYSNGCYIVNADNEVMENGDTINPGLVQDIYCPVGGSTWIQGVLSLPAPGSDSLFYVFNLDMGQPYLGSNYIGIAPEILYYQVVDMSENGGLGKVIEKNQIAIQDTFSRANIQAVRHANGIDWWVITAKSHTNCYFLTLVTEQGVQPPILECEGKVWSDLDLSGQAVFSPNGEKYIRFNADNGLNIFDFDNETGELSNPIEIVFPDDTFYLAGTAVSSNSRFLYASTVTKLYQFDLQAADIPASKTLIGEWDGYDAPFPVLFYIMALAPDGKIYIASTSSHKFLHVINRPDCPGELCDFQQRGVSLPSYNFATIPNFPHYRNLPSNVECDSISSTILENQFYDLKVYPNPSSEYIIFELPETIHDAEITIYDMTGRRRIARSGCKGRETINLNPLGNGIYIYEIRAIGSTIKKGKLVKEK
jgi:hypothetical protein